MLLLTDDPSSQRRRPPLPHGWTLVAHLVSAAWAGERRCSLAAPSHVFAPERVCDFRGNKTKLLSVLFVVHLGAV